MVQSIAGACVSGTVNIGTPAAVPSREQRRTPTASSFIFHEKPDLIGSIVGPIHAAAAKTAMASPRSMSSRRSVRILGTLLKVIPTNVPAIANEAIAKPYAAIELGEGGKVEGPV